MRAIDDGYYDKRCQFVRFFFENVVVYHRVKYDVGVYIINVLHVRHTIKTVLRAIIIIDRSTDILYWRCSTRVNSIVYIAVILIVIQM